MSWIDRYRPRRLPQHPHLPHSPLASREVLGESPFWPTLAVLGAAALYATMPTRFIAGPDAAGIYGAVRWIVPGLTVALLVPLALTVPQTTVLHGAGERLPAVRLSRRIASLAVIAVITAANVASIVLLVHLLVNGAKTEANQLLRAGLHMWSMNVIIFGLWFWQLDGGGPIERRRSHGGRTDFLFPQQALEREESPAWQPNFIDYLFVSYTNATAFSPTDTMPLSQWAKMLMIFQSAASLLLAIMVVARAVNILQ